MRMNLPFNVYGALLELTIINVSLVDKNEPNLSSYFFKAPLSSKTCFWIKRI